MAAPTVVIPATAGIHRETWRGEDLALVVSQVRPIANHAKPQSRPPPLRG